MNARPMTEEEFAESSIGYLYSNDYENKLEKDRQDIISEMKNAQEHVKQFLDKLEDCLNHEPGAEDNNKVEDKKRKRSDDTNADSPSKKSKDLPITQSCETLPEEEDVEEMRTCVTCKGPAHTECLICKEDICYDDALLCKRCEEGPYCNKHVVEDSDRDDDEDVLCQDCDEERINEEEEKQPKEESEEEPEETEE